MKLIIDIPEKTFEYYVTLVNKGEQIGNLERIILDGKPLPKGHGKIIDSNEFNHYLISRDSSFKALIAKIPPIIEADKESKE